MITDSIRVSDYYKFYENNKQNGLRYDVTIDNAIIERLNSENGTINNKNLKSEIESSIGRRVPSTTFQTHLNILVNYKILNRDDVGRGKEVLYSLTRNARKLLKLNLLKQSSPEEIMCRKIFEKLFFYLLHRPPAKTISSEKEFDRFLKSEVNLSSKDLKWGKIETGDNYEIVDIIYGNVRERDGGYYGGLLSPPKTLSKKEKSKLSQNIKEYWRVRRPRSKVLENIEFICIPIPENIDFLVTKTEHWEITKPSKIRKYTEDTYLITLSGVSIRELMKGSNVCTICRDFDGQAMVSMNLLMKSNNSKLLGTGTNFESADIEKALVLLVNNGLVKIASGFYGNEKRYVLADGRLRDFIEALRNIHEMEFNILFDKWSYFEEPSEEEKSRISRLLGENESRKIFKDTGMTRYQHRKMMKKCKNVEGYNRHLKVIYADNDDSDWRRYSVDNYMDYKLKAFKRERKVLPTTKKDLKKEIQRYNQFLMKDLESKLENLYHDPYSEGVDFIWLIHGLTIQKYESLHEIIRVICPRIIEVAEDEERLSNIDKDRLEIFPGWEGKQPKLSDSTSIYVHDQASLISASIIDKPITEKIPDITKYLWRLRPNHKTNKRKEEIETV